MGPEFLLTALIPAGVDLVKNLFGSLGRKFLGLSVDDELKLQDADIRKLEALSKIDNPYGTPSQWVIDVRASFRYISAAVLVLGGLAITAYGATEGNKDIINVGLETAGTPFLFIFGERMWNNMKK